MKAAPFFVPVFNRELITYSINRLAFSAISFQYGIYTIWIIG